MATRISGLRTNGGDHTAPGPSGLPVRRRWGRVALGVGLVVVWIWGTAAVVLSAGDRSEVLAVAHEVGRFEPIEQGDLKVVRVGADSGVRTVSAGQLDDLVGQAAAVDLVPGALLSPDQLVEEGERVVGDSDALVGARLKPEEFPPGEVRSGSDVLIVVRPAPIAGSEEQGVREVEGWLLSVGEAEEATGARSVSLVVPRSAAPDVTAAAAEGRVSVVVLE